MSEPIIAPKWQDAPLSVQLWMEQVTEALTGRLEGGAKTVAVKTDIEGVASAATAASTAAAAAAESANTKADATTVDAQQATIEAQSAKIAAVETSVAATASQDALDAALARITALEA